MNDSIGNPSDSQASGAESVSVSGLQVQVEAAVRLPQPKMSAAEWRAKHTGPDSYPLPVISEKPVWKSVEAFEGLPVDSLTARAEFPMGAGEAPSGASRRDFMGLLSASLAVLGTACVSRTPTEKIYPYTKRPADVTPGLPTHYATSREIAGLSTGLLVGAYEGRPVKVEGNPLHPESKGGASVYDQAETLSLYDPSRARILRRRGAAIGWETFKADAAKLAQKHAADGGAKLRFLLEPSSSPLLGEQREAILAKFPNARIYAYAPFAQENADKAAELVFGQRVSVSADFGAADVVLSLGNDFLGNMPGSTRSTRQFAARREPGPNMNRLYVAETQFTSTGGFADHRLRTKPSALRNVATAIAAAVGRATGSALADLAVPTLTEKEKAFVDAVAKDLTSRGGRALVTVGETQPVHLHALALAINGALGAIGPVVSLRAPLRHESAGIASLVALTREIEAGQVDTLVITANNPVYASPVALGFDKALEKVPNVLYRSMHEDDTFAKAHWFVPATHAFESWGDTRAFDGSIAITQPLIDPLFNGVTESEFLAAMVGDFRSGYEIVKDSWRRRAGSPVTFEAQWERWLATGLLPSSKTETLSLGANLDAAISAVRSAPAIASVAGGYELDVTYDQKVFDGRYAGNAWLQELAEHVTKLTWDNAALVAPSTAKALDVKQGDLLELTVAGQKLTAPVFVLPGHAVESITLTTGYGQSKLNEACKGTGVNAYQLLSPTSFQTGVEVSKAKGNYRLATTQEHWSMEGRDLALEFTQAKWESNPAVLDHLRGTVPSAYEPVEYNGYKWGMAIDLSRCTGCSACLIACQTENNIPVVGKEQVIKNREMAWLRIDRYFAGDDIEEPTMVSQPVTCQHCETAPCEYVCPVNATVHSDEGLNDMVYNRCIGTRYCSNNCPYKVRRFNFLNFTGGKSPMEQMARHPEVTVRARGVMEKCTYCVQRIEAVRIQSRIKGEPIAADALQTACQQSCSAGAITFGDLNNHASRVAQQAKSARRYDLLHFLATKPRTTYLVRIKNPNPELV